MNSLEMHLLMDCRDGLLLLVTKGDFFLILCKKNYSKILITVIMTKAVLRSPVNR